MTSLVHGRPFGTVARCCCSGQKRTAGHSDRFQASGRSLPPFQGGNLRRSAGVPEHNSCGVGSDLEAVTGQGTRLSLPPGLSC